MNSKFGSQWYFKGKNLNIIQFVDLKSANLLFVMLYLKVEYVILKFQIKTPSFNILIFLVSVASTNGLLLRYPFYVHNKKYM